LASIDVLQSVPLFQGMTDRSIGVIADLAEPATFAAGDTLTREGDPGDSFIVLTSGTADVRQGDRSIRTLGAGDFLGEISLIDGGPRTATVTALTELDLLVIGQREFSALLTEVPGLAHKIMVNLAGRVRELDERVYG